MTPQQLSVPSGPAAGAEVLRQMAALRRPVAGLLITVVVLSGAALLCVLMRHPRVADPVEGWGSAMAGVGAPVALVVTEGRCWRIMLTLLQVTGVWRRSVGGS
ncbi:hypothetical protein V7793_18225 [Streptomyces sp. KLMMK]|uniref:hypothetical protein n=1 Tax=Streptomyces sp. KLMMK TaxID=3109353 RepID=UPI00300893C5